MSERHAWRRRLLRGPFVLLIAALLWNFAAPPWYRFDEPRPFTGPNWYDPYSGFGGELLRANFHTHTRAWLGLTNGVDSPQAVTDHYLGRGYDVAAISNYMSITGPTRKGQIYVPAYEHGLNFNQTHLTVLGAQSVLWFDYPWKGLRQKQHVLDLVAEDGVVVFTNHPTKAHSFSIEEMALLSGYQGLEIASKYTPDGTPHWDAALSAGRPVWGIAADDGHHVLHRQSHSEIGWLLVHGSSRESESVLESLRLGHFHAVWDRENHGPNRLLESSLSDGRLAVRVAEPADEIRFIGQEGAVRKTVRDASRAAYELTHEDTYVRTEVWTRGSALFLNPVFRFEDEPFSRRRPQIRTGLTWAARIGGGILLALVAAWACLPARSRPRT